MDLHLTYEVNGRSIRSSACENDDYLLEISAEDEAAVSSPDGCAFSMRIRAKRPLILREASVTLPQALAPGDRILVNGFQSWTDTREYLFEESLHDLRRVPAPIRKRFHFDAYGDTHFYLYRADELHGFTYGYVRHPDGETDLIGSKNEENAYLILAYEKRNGRVRLQSDCDGRHVTDTFMLFSFVRYRGRAQRILRAFFESLGHCDAKPLRGYTSWYRFYQNINEEKMLENLNGIDAREFDLFQIDDGYETFVGDWLDTDPDKFPSGLAPVVEKIHDKKLLAGIWLAPFVCEQKSRLFRERPDLILRDEAGGPVFAGCNWSGQVVLDIRKEAVREYLRKVFEHFRSLGFDFFKLDFLYAATLIRDREGGRTRAEIMREGMVFLRECLKDRLFLSCGVPLSSAFGLCDYARIGPDVSLRFDDVFYMRPMHRERVSTKVTLLNTVFRSCMDKTVFRCDPDVFLLRDEDIHLSRAQRKALVTLNHLCGALTMTSDDVGKYDPANRELLAGAQALSGAAISDIRFDGRIAEIVFYPASMEESAGGTSPRVLKYDAKKGILLPSDKNGFL